MPQLPRPQLPRKLSPRTGKSLWTKFVRVYPRTNKFVARCQTAVEFGSTGSCRFSVFTASPVYVHREPVYVHREPAYVHREPQFESPENGDSENGDENNGDPDNGVSGYTDRGTRELVTTEASYLFASVPNVEADQTGLICERVCNVMQEHFGTFLLIEVWARDRGDDVISDNGLDSDVPSSAEEAADDRVRPTFEVVAVEPESIGTTLDAFTNALRGIKIDGRSATAEVRQVATVAPNGLRCLTESFRDSGSNGCVLIGLIVDPVYLNHETGEVFPVVLQELRAKVAWAYRKTVAKFTRFGEHLKPKNEKSAKLHFESLGPTSLVKAARLADQQLCEVSESFDFLLQVTPTNSEITWQEFRRSDARVAPVLQYRPLPFHPRLLKRDLFNIEIERIEDPTLAHLCWEKQNQIDCQITALQNLDTERFILTSKRYYGEPDDALVGLATEILGRYPEPDRVSDTGKKIRVKEIARMAREEIDYYHKRMSEFNGVVEVNDSIASGIMVSHDRLMLSSSLSLPKGRIKPLFHHEIGTHLLTYFNGRCQPFRQLYAGMSGYEELQEGLAVLSEHLTGGLTVNRLRTLAGRVIAVHRMLSGDSFIETFNTLYQNHHFPERSSFLTTLRVFRGGGMTKDIIYLRGLRDLLNYLSGGHGIEPLYVGKIGLQHLPYIQEMRRRGIIVPPRVLPRFLKEPGLRDRLDACRGSSVADLLDIKV